MTAHHQYYCNIILLYVSVVYNSNHCNLLCMYYGVMFLFCCRKQLFNESAQMKKKKIHLPKLIIIICEVRLSRCIYIGTAIFFAISI